MKPLFLAILLSTALGSLVLLSGRDLPRTDHDVVHLAEDAIALAR